MRLLKQLVVLFLFAGVIFGTLALFSMDVIKIEWVTFMEIQSSFGAQEDPLGQGQIGNRSVDLLPFLIHLNLDQGGRPLFFEEPIRHVIQRPSPAAPFDPGVSEVCRHPIQPGLQRPGRVNPVGKTMEAQKHILKKIRGRLCIPGDGKGRPVHQLVVPVIQLA